MTGVHGLVIGKFYPPHRGHHHLIDTAAKLSDRVTVVVAGSSVESLSIDDRAAWVRDTHRHQQHVAVVEMQDDIPIDYSDDVIWDQHMALFEAAIARAAVRDGLDARAALIDTVFTSEPYGDEMARRLGARHVSVDPDRQAHPCSGTAVRADVPGHWDDLAPATRGGLALRVVFLGAESTGTTTVSQAVAARLAARGGAFTATAWVPEHGRDFTIERLAMAHALTTRVGRPATTMDDITWTSEDFVDIAARQNQLEDEAARTGGPVLVCDTDAFTTGIWHERYMGHRSAAVERLGRRHPLYLLTDHSEVPFVQDGIRDGEHIRAWMTHRLAEALAATDRPFQILTGTVEERTEAALAAIDELLARSWRFADPLLPPAPAAPGEFFP